MDKVEGEVQDLGGAGEDHWMQSGSHNNATNEER